MSPPTRRSIPRRSVKAPEEVAYDEMHNPNGVVRPHWKQLRTFVDRVGSEEIERRQREAERMVRDLGMIAQDRSGEQAWRLDPIPMSLSVKDWRFIQRSVAQRARLLNSLLQDLYGKQEILQRGLLPADLVLSNPEYLRPCHGTQLWRQHYLHLYAVDLARSPDGRWWVLSDHTQSPAGLGYLMQNRIIVSRTFPELFRKCHVRRLSDFLGRWSKTLAACSPRQGVKSEVVFLTPGAHHETYFEHVFLSRYLGCPLVEGADLVVRDDQVFLKTLGGLTRVDVILRHLEDHLCDPLELRQDSLLGVPGLLCAVRARNVTLVNPLGSGVVQTPALNPFLPALCRELMGEELLMPPVATWWCGQPTECEYVLEHVSDLVLRPAFGNGRLEFGGFLNADKQAKIRQQIKARPRQYIGQEHLRLSRSPVWVDDRLEPRPVTLRVFAAFDGRDYFVLPGALCGASQGSNSYDVFMETGGVAKDVWLIEPRIPEKSPPLALPPVVGFQRGSADLPSRIADRMFWLGRYSERAEFTTRLLREAIRRIGLEQGGSELDDILPLLRTLAHQQQLSTAPLRALSLESVEHELGLAVLDRTRQGSLTTVIARLTDNAAGLRDRLSEDTWRTLRELDTLLGGCGEKPPPLVELVPLLNDCLLRLSAFAGQIHENMTAGYDLQFLELGRFLERANYTSQLMLESLPDAKEILTERQEVLLRALDCIITYRRRYYHLQVLPMLDLVLADETNPRSLASQLQQIEERLKQLPGADAGHFVRSEEKRIHEGLSQIRLLSWHPETSEKTIARVRRILRPMEKSLAEVAHQLNHRYFVHSRIAASGNSSPL